MPILHPITVDSRENVEIVSALERLGAPAKHQQLPDNGGGDFRWLLEPDKDGDEWASVTIERKTASDLLNSAEDGRLSAFTSTPSTPLALRALLLHGGADVAWGGRHTSAESVDNLLASIQSDGIIVLRAANGTDGLAKRLVSFWKWSGKRDHGSYHRPALPAMVQGYFDPREKIRVANLMTIPSLGEVRSRMLLRKFTLREIYEMLIHENTAPLREVKGVGNGVISDATRFLA